MSKDYDINEENNFVEEPASESNKAGEYLKTDILRLVEQTNDEKVLKIVWNILQKKETSFEAINLSGHIQKIFDQYPDTLKKLAQ